MVSVGIRPCDVCVLVNHDDRPKRTQYCNLCNAHICDECRKRWDWRAVAAMKKGAHWTMAALGLARELRG